MSMIYTLLLCVFILEFVFESYYFTNSYFCMILFLFCSVSFIFKRRRESKVCPDLLFLLFAFVVFFYKELIMDNVEFISALFDQFSDKQYLRGRCLNMIAFFSYLLGANYRSNVNMYNNKLKIIYQFNIGKVSFYLPHFTTLFLILSFVSGKISLVNHYALSNVGFSNTFIVFNTILIVITTVVEFIRLYFLGTSCFKQFMLKVNKQYLFTFTIYALILLNIGYRSGAILVVLPFIISYSIFIKEIEAKKFFIILMSGILCMVIIGFTRSGDGFSTSTFTFYNSLRDFGPAYLTNTGLISYTDSHGIHGIGMGLRQLFSSIPFLGGIVEAISPSSYSVDEQSAVLATKLFQSKNNLESGLGTSLIGDLYYSGHLIWVVIYMFLLGRISSICYEKIYHIRKIDIYTFVLYLWFFANSVFLLRAEWYSYFRYIGFSWMILFVLQFVYTKKIYLK